MIRLAVSVEGEPRRSSSRGFSGTICGGRESTQHPLHLDAAVAQEAATLASSA